MLCVSDSSQRLSRAHSYALGVIHLLFSSCSLSASTTLSRCLIPVSSGISSFYQTVFLFNEINGSFIGDFMIYFLLVCLTMISWCCLHWICGRSPSAKILSCVLSCSSQCPYIWVWWWSIVALAQRRSCSSHRELFFLAPLSRWFYHDGRDPNNLTCQCQRLEWVGNGRSSPSLAESVMFLPNVMSFFCWIMFLVSSSLFSVPCWFILSSCWFILSSFFLSVRRYLTLIAPVLEKITMTDLDSVLVFQDEFWSLPLFRLVHPSVLQGSLQDVTSFWPSWRDPYVMNLRCMIPPVTVQTPLTWRTSIRRELFMV